MHSYQILVFLAVGSASLIDLSGSTKKIEFFDEL
jgi:hypothetical protein